MEQILISLITEYGVDGLMAAALVFIVIRFDRRLVVRDRENSRQRGELITLVKNNTQAMTGLKVIIESLRK